MGLPRPLKEVRNKEIKNEFTFKMMLKDLFSFKGSRRLPVPKIREYNKKTIIDFDLSQLSKDVKELKEITDLVEAKKEILEKYKIKIIATKANCVEV